MPQKDPSSFLRLSGLIVLAGLELSILMHLFVIATVWYICKQYKYSIVIYCKGYISHSIWLMKSTVLLCIVYYYEYYYGIGYDL